jgi:PHP family Zn ribbon phosphoesterase
MTTTNHHSNGKTREWVSTMDTNMRCAKCSGKVRKGQSVLSTVLQDGATHRHAVCPDKSPRKFGKMTVQGMPGMVL